MIPQSSIFKECRSQIQRYLKGNQSELSLSCVAILKQATQANPEALAFLVELVTDIAQRKLRSLGVSENEELLLEVCDRILDKFITKEKLFQVTTFAAFVQYVNVVATNATRARKNQRNLESLEYIREHFGIEFASDFKMESVEQRILVNEILSLLSDELEREAIRRRFMLGETPEEVAISLQKLQGSGTSEITKEQVYRLVEHGIRRLRKLPQFQRLVQDLWT